VLVNGQPEPNVEVHVYEPGTTNEITVYEDEGVTPITQPILTDSQGRYAFFVDVDTYPEIRLYLEKDGVDFSEANEDLDGVPVPGAGAGAGTFLELTDTPSSYVGRGGDVVLVKTTEDGIETQPWPVTGTILNFFLSDDAADIGSYYYMYPTESGDGYSELTSPSLSTGDDQLLWAFVTEAGEPGIEVLALGAYTATLFLKKTGNKDVRVYWKLFKRDTGGTETEILQSAVSDYLTADNSQYLISGYLNEDQALDPTDRLVLKLYANVSGTGTDVTVTLTMEGDYDSRLTINVLSSAFNLDRLSDVTISSPSNDEVLAYDSGSGKWLNKAPTFLKLADTPSSFTGKAGYSPVVNEAENALEFAKRVTVTESDMTIYVDYDNGSDETGDGSPGAPYKTIQRAIDELPDLIAHNVEIAVSGGPHVLSAPISFIGKQVTGVLTLKAKDTNGNDLYDFGTATGGSSTTLEDTSKSWPTDFWKGGWVFIYQGTGAGEVRAISGNTATTLTIDSGTAPDTTSDYVIVKVTIDSNSDPDIPAAITNIPQNLHVFGFRFINAPTNGYALQTAAPLTGHAGLEFKYNLVVNGQNGVSIQTWHECSIRHNLFEVGNFGIVVGYYAYATPRANCFKAITSGSGTGLYTYGLSLASLETGDEANTFINLAKGCWAILGGMIKQGSFQVYSGCTTDYEPSTASDPSYIS